MVKGITLLVLLAFAVGVILLQVFLSKRRGRWFGVILPVISFLVSVMMVISIISYTNIGITSHSVTENGVIVSHEIQDTRADFDGVVGQVAVTFVMFNIPTVILVAVYVACRERGTGRSEMEKMRVQDLG